MYELDDEYMGVNMDVFLIYKFEGTSPDVGGVLGCCLCRNYCKGRNFGDYHWQCQNIEPGKQMVITP